MSRDLGTEDLLEMVRAMRALSPIDKLDELIAAHRPDEHGRCPTCHTIGCTVAYLAFSARYAGRAR